MNRRRAARYVGIAILVDGLLLVAAYTVLRPLVLDQFAAGDNRNAAAAVWDAFLKGLRSDAVWLAIAGAAVAVLMWAARARRGLVEEQAESEHQHAQHRPDRDLAEELEALEPRADADDDLGADDGGVGDVHRPEDGGLEASLPRSRRRAGRPSEPARRRARVSSCTAARPSSRSDALSFCSRRRPVNPAYVSASQ